jgi:glycosyltransferase involved in cell wall biosynthesis
MSKRKTQASAPRELKPILMYPLPSHAARDVSNSINQIVVRLAEHLPKYGYRLTEDPLEAVLTACHAGQCGNGAYADVAHCHGLYPTASGQSEFWHWGANVGVIQSLRAAKQITVPSQWVADILRRDMNVEPDVIGWAVDFDEWQPAENYGYVLWNKTRADAVCDPKPMIDLAAKSHNQLFLTTFGTGTPNIKTIGRVPFEEMKEHVRHAGVYLATTKETFGIGILEAMACGVPVLGYRHGAISDIVEHGKHGFLAEVGDIQGLIDGLAFCLKHRDVLGANARKRAQEYTWDKVAEQFAAVYDRALAPHTGVKVSVVIPCYNYGKWVGEAIESVFSQKTNFEVQTIIVNDESTDNSKEVIEQILGDNPERNAYLINKLNGGVAVARNFGIQVASGEYIVCLDADDMLGSPDFLQTLADAMDADRALGIAFTSLQVISETGELADGISAWPDGWDFDKQVSGFNQVPTCCMFRREAWARAGGYRTDCEPAEDANLWLRIGALGYGAKHVVKLGWFHYRDHAGSLSKTRPQPNWRNFAWVADNQRPFAAQGNPPRGSFPVRNYDTPLVSIIIPVGQGHGEIVKRALDSVEAQTERNWECILVSDGMGTPLNGYTWVKYAETGGIGLGAAKARNIGLTMARAPLVAFLDADDYLHPRYLEKTLQAHRRSGRYVYTDWVARTKQGTIEPHQSEDYDVMAVFRKSSIHAVNVLMRRKDALAVGGFDENLPTWEDPDFFMKLAAAGICGERVPEPLFAYDYTTGTLREKAEAMKASLKDILYNRYRDYIEGIKMCSCNNSPKGTNGALPESASLNGAASHPEFGAMVMVEYQGSRAGKEVIGATSRTRYQYRQNGDVFFVWEVDMIADPESFLPLAAPEVDIEKTVMPAEPEYA